MADIDEMSEALDPEESCLDEAVMSFARDAGRAVPSLLGFSVTLVIHSQPIELVSMPDTEAGGIRSSLQLTLADLVTDGVHGVVTFYAEEADAFLQLAADLRASAEATTSDLRIDTALTPNLVSGITGFRELSTINRALGVLISRGNNRQHADDLLLRAATTTRTGMHESAARILGASPT